MSPIKPITMQDVRLVAGEGKLPAWAVLQAVNAILRQKGIVVDEQSPPKCTHNTLEDQDGK